MVEVIIFIVLGGWCGIMGWLIGSLPQKKGKLDELLCAQLPNGQYSKLPNITTRVFRHSNGEVFYVVAAHLNEEFGILDGRII